ncbi:hypothetical protein GCM10018980_16310 [Streptomyces capoamus]|uniref:Uncharacterized protein n=2 Tax=Streptomyces capoamus TaxID=68183 RepID=A0A919C3C8_9ACTN|nr:hypothetical protein GCM10018980_16310 [Streptomyces capoamus]
MSTVWGRLMKRTSAFALTLLAAAAALLPSTTVTAQAARGPGQVCFWTDIGQHGQAWCYGPPGYAEAENSTQRHAVSFVSSVNVSVYAISYTAVGCLYREIRPGDYSENWEWANKLDGVSDNPMGCDQG